jgi:hypothetical protein
MEPEFSLEQVIAQTRRRLGWESGEGEGESPGEGEGEAGEAPGENAASDAGPYGCPGPTLDDVRPAAGLRDRLVAALRADSDAMCAKLLTELSSEWELHPGLDALCQPVTFTGREGFLPHLARELVMSAMDLAASGRRSGLRHCSEPWCGLPFLDGSRDGRGRYCSTRCSGRAKARRRRDRAFTGDQSRETHRQGGPS